MEYTERSIASNIAGLIYAHDRDGEFNADSAAQIVELAMNFETAPETLARDIRRNAEGGKYPVASILAGEDESVQLEVHDMIMRAGNPSIICIGRFGYLLMADELAVRRMAAKCRS